MKIKHCISDQDLETGQTLCITHQTLICKICRISVDEDQILCDKCKKETNEHIRTN